MSRAIISCGTCGSRVNLVWGGIETLGAWTGKCTTCGTIITATKEEVTHV